MPLSPQLMCCEDAYILVWKFFSPAPYINVHSVSHSYTPPQATITTYFVLVCGGQLVPWLYSILLVPPGDQSNDALHYTSTNTKLAK